MNLRKARDVASQSYGLQNPQYESRSVEKFQNADFILRIENLPCSGISETLHTLFAERRTAGTRNPGRHQVLKHLGPKGESTLWLYEVLLKHGFAECRMNGDRLLVNCLQGVFRFMASGALCWLRAVDV